MTDSYGSAPHDHDLADHEHGDATGSHQEGWHGDHPPVDDFADHANDHTGEETASVSEETGLGEEVESEHTEAAGRSLPLLPIAAGIGLILLLGAGLYWQFGMSKSSNSVPIALNSSPVLPVGVALPPAQPVTPVQNSAGQTPAMLTLNTVPSSQTVVSPTPTSQPVDVMPTTSLPVAVAVPVTPPVPMAQVVPVVTPAPVSPTTNATPTASPAVEGRLNTLSNKVDDLQKSLDQATQKLTQVATLMSSQTSTQGANPALDERVTKIEQQLSQLDHKNRTTPSPTTKPAALASANDASLIDMSSTPKPIEPLARPLTHKPHHMATVAKPHKPVRSAKPASQTPVAQPVAAAHEPWMLRAATPNEAWVAKDVNTSELRHIQVGDTLPGIGQVKGIHQTGNGWTIEGSQGTIH